MITLVIPSHKHGIFSLSVLISCLSDIRLFAAASQLYGELLQRDPNDTKSRIQHAKALLYIVSTGMFLTFY